MAGCWHVSEAVQRAVVAVPQAVQQAEPLVAHSGAPVDCRQRHDAHREVDLQGAVVGDDEPLLEQGWGMDEQAFVAEHAASSLEARVDWPVAEEAADLVALEALEALEPAAELPGNLAAPSPWQEAGQRARHCSAGS